MLPLFAITLAYRPFLDPLNLHEHWLWLMFPLVFAVSLVYKALKQPTLDSLMFHTLRMSAYLILFMVGVAAALWIVVELV